MKLIKRTSLAKVWAPWSTSTAYIGSITISLCLRKESWMRQYLLQNFNIPIRSGSALDYRTSRTKGSY
jgi:hypothetical protein